MNWELDAEQPAAQIVSCYARPGAHLHVGVPLLELRIGSNPIQTLAYGASRRVVVRRVMPEATHPIAVLPASLPLAIVESVREGASDVPQAILIVSIFRQEGSYRAMLSLATWREDERALVLEVVPGRLESSRLPPRHRASLSRPRPLLAAGPVRRMRCADE